MILETRDLSHDFDGLRVLSRVNLSVQRGERHAVIGPNGAGKTTLFNCLTGFQAPDEGTMRFRETAIEARSPDRIAALGLARTFQTSRVFKRMTVLEHVLIGRYRHQRAGFWAAVTRPGWVAGEEEAARRKGLELLALFEDRLLPRVDDFADSLSYANRRRLEIARALATEPALLLLDEPTAGMNPHESAGIVRLIQAIRDRGIAVFLIEHDMKVIMNASDRIIVLDHGEKIAEGIPDAIRRNDDVVAAYMGRRGTRA